METPETRYAKNGDVAIAYQVIGEGPIDLLLIPGFISNVELAWEEPGLAAWYRELADVLPADRLRQAWNRAFPTGVTGARGSGDAHGRRACRHGRRRLERAVIIGYSEGSSLAASVRHHVPRADCRPDPLRLVLRVGLDGSRTLSGTT